jgi:LSU ribosomal protein L9P
MEVILLQDVVKLGKSGQLAKVNDGYARNFLIPKGLAAISTVKNIKMLERQKQLKTVQEDKKKNWRRN